MKQDEIIQNSLSILRDGGVILYPTDTIWGLGCDATNPSAVAKIYAIKRRCESKSLVLLASDLDMVAKYIQKIPSIAIDLVEVNDRPMTIVYPGAIVGAKPSQDGTLPPAERHTLAFNTVAEDGSVGIRIPMMEFCRNLVHKLGHPLVSTSANISGESAPQCFDDIPEEIRSAVDYIVPSQLEKESSGLPSQIIKVELDGCVTIIRA